MMLDFAEDYTVLAPNDSVPICDILKSTSRLSNTSCDFEARTQPQANVFAFDGKLCMVYHCDFNRLEFEDSPGFTTYKMAMTGNIHPAQVFSVMQTSLLYSPKTLS